MAGEAINLPARSVRHCISPPIQSALSLLPVAGKHLTSNICIRGHDHPRTGPRTRLASLISIRTVMSVYSPALCAMRAQPRLDLSLPWRCLHPGCTSHLHGSTASSFSSCICGGSSRCDAAHLFAPAHCRFPVNVKLLVFVFVLGRSLMVSCREESICLEVGSFVSCSTTQCFSVLFWGLVSKAVCGAVIGKCRTLPNAMQW